MTVSAKEKAQIKRQGYADVGGIPRQTYWTPDGREVKGIASWREYNIKDDEGNVTGSGVRDANLDKGWLLQPPRRKKPHCDGCDKWHDTKKEVIECTAKREESARRWDDWAKKEKEGEAMAQGKELEDLKSEMFELKGMVHELTQALKERK